VLLKLSSRCGREENSRCSLLETPSRRSSSQRRTRLKARHAETSGATAQSTNGRAERIDLLGGGFVLQELQFKMVALKELQPPGVEQPDRREKQDQLASLYKAKPDHVLGERASCDR